MENIPQGELDRKAKFPGGYEKTRQNNLFPGRSEQSLPGQPSRKRNHLNWVEGFAAQVTNLAWRPDRTFSPTIGLFAMALRLDCQPFRHQAA